MVVDRGTAESTTYRRVRHSKARNVGLALVVSAVALGLPLEALGQSKPESKTESTEDWHPGTTLDGQPDMQGSWSVIGGAIHIEHNLEDGSDKAHIAIHGQKFNESHVVINPPDNKIPYLPSALAQRKLHLENIYNPNRKYRDPVTSCMLRGVPRVLFRGVQILQPRGMVVIMSEENHAYRIIPLDKRAHVGANIKLWMGDSRGWWEGQTLVIDARNFNDQSWFDRSGNFHSDSLRVVERWTFVSQDRIDYEATIEDPMVFTKPWKMALKLEREEITPGYEFLEDACHEGFSVRPESRD